MTELTELQNYLSVHADRYPTSNGNDLLWHDKLGFGYLKSNGFDYGSDYWENYVNLLPTKIGIELTEYRGEFARKNGVTDPTQLCDVGIGSGQFVGYMGCAGYDINPHAVTWLKEQGKFADPYQIKFPYISLWDVLEHIDDQTELFDACQTIITSVPIHQNAEACLRSKHLKPNEHIWHFSEAGIQKFMSLYGFDLTDVGDGETRIGRESILSFCFKRR